MLSTFPDIYILDVGFESVGSFLICLNSVGFADQPVQFEIGFDLRVPAMRDCIHVG